MLYDFWLRSFISFSLCKSSPIPQYYQRPCIHCLNFIFTVWLRLENSFKSPFTLSSSTLPIYLNRPLSRSLTIFPSGNVNNSQWLIFSSFRIGKPHFFSPNYVLIILLNKWTLYFTLSKYLKSSMNRRWFTLNCLFTLRPFLITSSWESCTKQKLVGRDIPSSYIHHPEIFHFTYNSSFPFFMLTVKNMVTF